MTRIPTVEIEVDGRRKIVNANDPRAQEHALTGPELPESPEDVAKLKKQDVILMLEAHDVAFDKAAKVEDLREQLCNVIFVDL